MGFTIDAEPTPTLGGRSREPTLPDHGASSVPLEEALQDADLVLIVTAHPSVDHDTVFMRAAVLAATYWLPTSSRYG